MKKAQYISLFAVACFSFDAFAETQRTRADTYKQLGSVSALAELCYGSYRLRALAYQRLMDGNFVDQVQGEGSKELREHFDNTYSIARSQRTLWVFPQRVFSRPLSCENQNDVNFIRKAEEILFSALGGN